MNKRQMILCDLSSPTDDSVNDGILLDRDAHLVKIDIKDACQIVPIHHVLGIQRRGQA